MPRPRRGHLLPLDARVLDVGASLVTRERPHFYGLEVARLLGRERSTVYKSLHRLVDARSARATSGQEGAATTGSPFGRRVRRARLARRPGLRAHAMTVDVGSEP